MQEAAAKVSVRICTKPRTPVQLAADVIDRVIQTQGDPYLQTREHELTWWQLSLLDVKLFLTACALSVIGVLAGAVWLLWVSVAPLVLSSRNKTKQKRT